MMQTRPLADTGVELSAIGLGGMPLSIDGRPSEAAGVKVIHAALDAGMTFIDTADVYCLDDDDIGHNERLIALALREWSGPGVFVATKGGLERPGGDWTSNASPTHLKTACEKSLRALGTERLDLYQLHAPDDEVPFAESVGALAQLQQAGKIRYVGLSNVSVAEIEEARGIVPIVSVQNRCNLHDTSAFDDGVVAYCEAHDIAFLPYSPVGGRHGLEDIGADQVLAEIAATHGATPYEIALAWLLCKSPVMIPIPGASRVASATSSARAASLALTEAEVATLDAAAGL